MSEEEKVDYLDVDEHIPGQNYVCLSFVSPEELIQNKEAFKACKFLQSYCKSEKLKFDDVYGKYKDFTYKYQDELQRDFDEQNKFQTSIRGVKVRGVYDTHEAAASRAKKLSSLDSNFHVFIGQVGYWLPWDPNADKVTDEVFQNSQLNDMMEKYQENNANRDIFYEEQKRDKIKAAQEEVRKNKEKQAKESEESEELKDKTYEIEDQEAGDSKIEDVIDKIGEKIESEVDRVAEEVGDKVEEKVNEVITKVEEKVEEKVDEVVTKVEEKVEEVVEGSDKKELSWTDLENKVEETEKKGEVVDEDLKKSIEDVDPWLKRKSE